MSLGFLPEGKLVHFWGLVAGAGVGGLSLEMFDVYRNFNFKDGMGCSHVSK